MELNHDMEATTLLDRVHRDLVRARADSERTHQLGLLFDGLNGVRARVDPSTWRDLVGVIANHPVLGSIHEDPMTRRSFEKPRGYAGDAVLLDYIYRRRGAREASAVGRAGYSYAVGRPAACAVRQRRDWLAFKIDRAADAVAGAQASSAGGDGAAPIGARVLSVASGHLREAESSAAVRSGALAELVALDADEESLAAVDAQQLPNVTTVHLSIGRLLARWKHLGEFDLIYSAGLYDYLEPELARKLTARLFAMLRPGGRLLFTNFLPTVGDAGYMEALMGWSLIYRDLDELASVTASIPATEIEHLTTFQDPYDAIGYCEVVRRSSAVEARSSS